jgi:hypothetical protein
MTTIILANGEAVTALCEPNDLLALIAAAAPSSWISIELDAIGQVKMNTFVINYFYGDGDEE